MRITHHKLRGFGEEKNISSESQGIIYKLFSRMFLFNDKLYSSPRHKVTLASLLISVIALFPITPHKWVNSMLCIACAFLNFSSAYYKVASAAGWQPLWLFSFFCKFCQWYQWNISIKKCAEVSRHRMRALRVLSKIASKLNRCYIEEIFATAHHSQLSVDKILLHLL